jgi:hypothetical protein
MPVVLEKPAKGQRDDVRTALEYWASRNPRYIEPPEVEPTTGGPGLRVFESLTKRFANKDDDDGTVHFGPGLKFNSKGVA